MARPSWLDASAVLLDVLKLYTAERLVRPGLSGIEQAVAPPLRLGSSASEGSLRTSTTGSTDPVVTDSVRATRGSYETRSTRPFDETPRETKRGRSRTARDRPG